MTNGLGASLFALTALAIFLNFSAAVNAEENAARTDNYGYASCYDNTSADLFRGQRNNAQSPYKFGGWIQASIMGNNHGNTNAYSAAPNGPASRVLDATSGNSYLLGTAQQTDLHVNQTWLYYTKQLDTKRGFDWGFRFDTSFGTDSKFGQCFGDRSFDWDWGTGDYNLSIMQLYAEAGYRDLKFRVGKFGSTMPYESICAPYNFFISHTYSCYNTPLTFSGAIAEYQICKHLSVFAGWTAGYHNSLENEFDDNGFLGNITFKPTDRLGLIYNLYIGKANGLNKRDDAVSFGRPYVTEENVTSVFILTYALTKKLQFVNEWLWANNNYDLTGNATTASRSYGTTQQLFYTINPKWSIGGRFEWLRADGTIFDHPAFLGGNAGVGANLYEATLGANWNPTPCFNLRPELRFDWSDYDGGVKPFNNGNDDSQISLGCAAIVKF